MRASAFQLRSHFGVSEDKCMDDLNGRVALVTGSSRGIGRAIAIGLAEAGADVAINFISRAGEAQAVTTYIQSLGRRCLSVQADVSIASDVTNLLRQTADRLGPVDVLVNNAGIARPQRVEEISETDWEQVITANLKSCFLVTQAALPGMRRRKWGRLSTSLQSPHR